MIAAFWLYIQLFLDGIRFEVVSLPFFDGSTRGFAVAKWDLSRGHPHAVYSVLERLFHVRSDGSVGLSRWGNSEVARRCVSEICRAHVAKNWSQYRKHRSISTTRNGSIRWVRKPLRTFVRRMRTGKTLVVRLHHRATETPDPPLATCLLALWGGSGRGCRSWRRFCGRGSYLSCLTSGLRSSSVRVTIRTTLLRRAAGHKS